MPFLEPATAAGVKAIVCGHKHVYRKVRHRGMDIVWAPATAMIDVNNELAARGTFPRPGYLEWTLSRPPRHPHAGRAGADVRDRHDALDQAQRRHGDDAAGVALGRQRRDAFSFATGASPSSMSAIASSAEPAPAANGSRGLR